MKKLTYFGLFVCLFSVCLASSAHAIDFKAVDAPADNDKKAIQGLNEKNSALFKNKTQSTIHKLGKEARTNP